MNLSAIQIDNRFKKLLKQHQDFDKFWTKLKALGPVAIVGGAVRDWALDREPKDLDLMIDCPNSELQKLLEEIEITPVSAGSDPRSWERRPEIETKRETNYFGSAKLHFLNSPGELTVDLWSLEQTWAFQTDPKNWSHCRLGIKPNFESWLDTPFFNIDAILYLVSEKRTLTGAKFQDAFQKQILDINYEANPSPSLCVLKSLLHKQKYGLNFSENLSQYLTQQIYSREVSYRDLSELYLKLYKKHFPSTLLESLPHPRLRKFLEGLLAPPF